MMILAFAIWTLVVFIYIAIGVGSWTAREPVGFFTGVQPPKIKEQYVRPYNHAVAIIWFALSAVWEVLGLPLLLFEQNSPWIILSVLGVVFLLVGICVAFMLVQHHYMEK